jgi:uncharacterized membrane protein
MSSLHLPKHLFPILFLLALLAATSESACYYDNEAELYGIDTNCDTTDVRYSTFVQQIVSNRCLGCHTQGGSREDSPFDTYEKLLPYIQDGSIISRINDASNPMPPSGLMSACDREKIQAWYLKGAPNN